MHAYRRSQVELLVERMSEPSRRLIAVFGPRQTGKTTAARQAVGAFPNRNMYVAIDQPDPFPDDLLPATGIREAQAEPTEMSSGWLAWLWRQARTVADSDPRSFVLILDEVQKIPDWSNLVKGLWDQDRAEGRENLVVVIMGSSSLLMQSGLTESLAGRFEPVRFNHWSYREMSDSFGLDLDRYIYFGGYPGAAPLLSDETRWQEYVAGSLIEPVIERDVLAMTRVDKPALLKQLFNLGATYSGQILSYNKMVGQLQDAGNTTTLARYLQLLSGAGLLAGLAKHSGSHVSTRASSPKLNVLNTALMAVASGYAFREARADRTFWGRIVESAVGAHLLNTVRFSTEVRYWRQSDLEVDFVLRRGARTIAIEVKAGKGPFRTPGLEAYGKRFDPYRTLVVGEGQIPLDDFLSVPADFWFES